MSKTTKPRFTVYLAHNDRHGGYEEFSCKDFPTKALAEAFCLKFNAEHAPKPGQYEMYQTASL